MNKLTAEKCRMAIESIKLRQASIREEIYLQALEIALPILEHQERGEWEWIEWGGGAMPVSDKSWVDIKWIDGYFSYNTFAAIWDWEHRSGADNIIAYRIIPERATNKNGSKA